MDNLTKEERRRNMRRIRSSRTEFENGVFKELRKRGINFQINYNKIIGKPDIAKPRKKRAIFLHSDFWHGWQFPRWRKKLPSEFWKVKIQKNRARDKQVLRILRSAWQVMIVWEHSLEKTPKSCIDKMASFLK